MNYDWRCQACDTVVSAGNSDCTTCGCPASCNANEVEQYKQKYMNSDAVRSQSDYRCFKCDHHLYTKGSFRASGGGVSEIFDVATENFAYVSCKSCGYTEFYKKSISNTAFVADILFGD